MKLPLLALDSAFGSTAACILSADGQIVAVRCDEKLQHSTSTLPLLSQLIARQGLSWQEIQSFAVGAGPGSFTGVRIAAATLAGLNASLSRPVYSLSSLAITALQSSLDEVWVVEDARAGELFVGHYRNGQALQDDVCIHFSELELPENAPIVSHMDDATWQKLVPACARLPLIVTRQQALAQLVRIDLQSGNSRSDSEYAQPVYLQKSQAERMAEHVSK